MGKFSKAGGREMPELNTSSLPDLVFAFLFFIMMVTSMREVTLKVVFQAPQATELQKKEKKSLVTFIYVGEPTQEYRAKMGTESRIQLNDSYAEVGEVQDFIFQERASMNEGDQAKMTVSLKVDQKTKMGITINEMEGIKPVCKNQRIRPINWRKMQWNRLESSLYWMKREKRPSKNILMMFDAFYRITENRPSVRRM